jgi:hypothetical protein
MIYYIIALSDGDGCITLYYTKYSEVQMLADRINRTITVSNDRISLSNPQNLFTLDLLNSDHEVFKELIDKLVDRIPEEVFRNWHERKPIKTDYTRDLQALVFLYFYTHYAWQDYGIDSIEYYKEIRDDVHDIKPNMPLMDLWL